jgi:hypothetical protein
MMLLSTTITIGNQTLTKKNFESLYWKKKLKQFQMLLKIIYYLHIELLEVGIEEPSTMCIEKKSQDGKRNDK